MSVDIFRVGRVWHYRFQVAGARIQRSTRLSGKTAAQALADRAYASAVANANGGELVPTLADLFAEWELVRGPVASAAHRKSVDVVRRLHLYDLGVLPVSDITTMHVERARNLHLVEHKPASANHWLRVIKLVVGWAVKRDIIPRLPFAVQMMKVQKRPRAILPLSEALAWFGEVDAATARTPEVATAIRLMFGAGLRASEASGARWEWVDWERGTYTPGVTKGREADPVPMPQWLIDHLTPRRRPEGLIAPRADGAQLPEGYARRAMELANARCRTIGMTPHRLRGSFATLLSEAGVPIQVIQAVMRHKNVATTMGYLEKNLGRVTAGHADIARKIGFQGEKVASDGGVVLQPVEPNVYR